MLNEIVERVIKEASDEDWMFTKEVEVDLYIETDREWELIDTKVTLQYKLEPEVRSWGIQGINFALETTKIEVGVEFEEDIIRIPIDLSEAHVDWMQGDAFTLTGVSIELTDDNGSLQLMNTPELLGVFLVP